jgi:hypothetical protein
VLDPFVAQALRHRMSAQHHMRRLLARFRYTPLVVFSMLSQHRLSMLIKSALH